MIRTSQPKIYFSWILSCMSVIKCSAATRAGENCSVRAWMAALYYRSIHNIGAHTGPCCSIFLRTRYARLNRAYTRQCNVVCTTQGVCILRCSQFCSVVDENVKWWLLYSPVCFFRSRFKLPRVSSEIELIICRFLLLCDQMVPLLNKEFDSPCDKVNSTHVQQPRLLCQYCSCIYRSQLLTHKEDFAKLNMP